MSGSTVPRGSNPQSRLPVPPNIADKLKNAGQFKEPPSGANEAKISNQDSGKIRSLEQELVKLKSKLQATLEKIYLPS